MRRLFRTVLYFSVDAGKLLAQVCTMTRTQTEIREIEAALGRARSSVPKLLAAAGINRSTWTRWRSGAVEPTMTKWRAVTDAVYMLTLVRF